MIQIKIYLPVLPAYFQCKNGLSVKQPGMALNN
jgi:hypothetical protein